MSRNPAEAFAAFARGLAPEDVPGPVLDRAKHLILDAVGIALASSRRDFAARMMAGLRELGGCGPCTVIGLDRGLPIRDAATMNAALIHGLDFDDTHLASVVHGTAVALPAALAVAEARAAPGTELLVAYVVAMESAIRIGLAADYGFHRNGYHATGVVGHFSAALAAGRLMGLDERALASAQGIVVSTATASREFWSDGSWNKRLHPGWAAVAGLTAASLARSGFPGCGRPYDGRFGIFAMHMGGEAESVDYGRLTDGLGERWELCEAAVKPFPTCHYTHAIIDGAAALREAHGLAPDDIARIEVRVHGDLIPVLSEPADLKRAPPDDYAARFSAPYAAACGLALGRLGLAELEPEALGNPDVLRLARLVDCVPDPRSRFPQYFSAGVAVVLRDGRMLSHHEAVNRGAGDRALSDREIVAKFEGNAVPILGSAGADALAGRVLRLEELDGRRFAGGLSPARLGLAA